MKRYLFLLLLFALVSISVFAGAEVEPLIVDDADLLTYEEENKLKEDMQPICMYGTPALWTIREQGSIEDDEEFISSFYANHIGKSKSGFLVVIDMIHGQIRFEWDGFFHRVILERDLSEITYNYADFLAEGKYYAFASSFFNRVFEKLKDYEKEGFKFIDRNGIKIDDSREEILAALGTPNREIISRFDEMDYKQFNSLGAANSYTLLEYQTDKDTKLEEAAIYYVLKDDKLCSIIRSFHSDKSYRSDISSVEQNRDYDYLLEGLISKYGNSDKNIGRNLYLKYTFLRSSIISDEDEQILPNLITGWSVDEGDILLYYDQETITIAYIDKSCASIDEETYSDGDKLDLYGL